MKDSTMGQCITAIYNLLGRYDISESVLRQAAEILVQDAMKNEGITDYDLFVEKLTKVERRID